MAQPTPPKDIVIVGGGIIGSCSAYYLSHHPSYNPSTTRITLLEATKIAGGASGKAGGLLALWAYPSSIVPLSFRLHKELAEQYNGKERWGYRGVYAGQIDVNAKGRKAKGPTNPAADRPTDEKDGGVTGGHGSRVSLQKRSKDAMALLQKAGVPKDLDWVIPEGVEGYDTMGDPSTTAQVHPYLFTTAMVEEAQKKGVSVIFGGAETINKADGRVSSVTYTDKESGEKKEIKADTVVLAAGAWCPNILPETPISNIRAHSVTIRPTRDVSNHILFTSIQLPSDFQSASEDTKKGVVGPRKGQGQTVTPEIYARPNNEVYACGEGDSLAPLPKSTDDVEVVEGRCQDIIDYVSAISDELRDGEVTARQACYLPLGGPLIGNTGTQGLILASGHTCWGIQNAPGTGKLVSELIWEGKAKSAKIGGLDPQKVM